MRRSFDEKLKNIQNRTSSIIKNKIDEANKRTLISIQNVDNKFQDKEKKITQLFGEFFEFFPRGTSYFSILKVFHENDVTQHILYISTIGWENIGDSIG